jgi:hypothetical protein
MSEQEALLHGNACHEQSAVMSALSCRGLHEFNSIPEGIVNIDSVVAFQALVLPHFVPQVAQLIGKLAQADDQQSRMRSSRRIKIRVRAEMNFEFAALKPASATICQIRRLANLRNPEGALIELAGALFTTDRHRKLYVFQAFD